MATVHSNLDMYFWSQTVGDFSAFISIFKQTIKDCFMQNRESDIHLNHKLEYYNNFKGGLYHVGNFCLSLGLYVLEDEYHLIMQCPKYLSHLILSNRR